jgi:hypothetical protein
MKQFLLILLLFCMALTSCKRVSEKAKETLNKAGEKVGEATTEFLEGVAEGVDKTLECEIVLSEELKKKGIQTGTFSVDRHLGSNNNKLTLYLIFEQDFKGTLFAKAFDKKGLEIGRSKIKVTGKAEDAGYYDFEFDERTNIGVRNKIVIE